MFILFPARHCGDFQFLPILGPHTRHGHECSGHGETKRGGQVQQRHASVCH